MSDLGDSPEVSPGEIKQRVCDEKGQFLDNYKTVLGKEEDFQKVTGGDLEDGLVSAHFPNLRLWGD